MCYVERSVLLMPCFSAVAKLLHGGHKPGKPVILRDFSSHGKLREFFATSGKNCNKLCILNSLLKYLCKTAVDWVNRIIRNRDEV